MIPVGVWPKSSVPTTDCFAVMEVTLSLAPFGTFHLQVKICSAILICLQQIFTVQVCDEQDVLCGDELVQYVADILAVLFCLYGDSLGAPCSHWCLAALQIGLEQS